jgi:N-methylhydantoinase A
MRTVLVPRFPGVLSAWGAANAPVRREYVRTIRTVAPPIAALRRIAADLGRRARKDMRDERVAARAVRLEIGLDARYLGQSFELEVPLTTAYEDSFHAEHERLYGHADRARAIEIVAVNLRASAPQGRELEPHAVRRSSPPPVSPRRGSTIRVLTPRGWRRAGLFRREELPAGAIVRGPAVLEELSATTYVPPRWSARVDPVGHLVLRHAR